MLSQKKKDCVCPPDQAIMADDDLMDMDTLRSMALEEDVCRYPKDSSKWRCRDSCCNSYFIAQRRHEPECQFRKRASSTTAEWIRYKDSASGQFYYCNTETQETQWDPPESPFKTAGNDTSSGQLAQSTASTSSREHVLERGAAYMYWIKKQKQEQDVSVEEEEGGRPTTAETEAHTATE